MTAADNRQGQGQGQEDSLSEASGTKPGIDELEKAKTVDTIHQDEALKVLANYQGEETWDEQEEKQLARRIDRKLLPLLCLTYGLQYYDKAMLSQAVSRRSFFKMRMC